MQRTCPCGSAGEPVSAKALRIGHVTRVLALRQVNGTLTTRGIDAHKEAIGLDWNRQDRWKWLCWAARRSNT